MFLSYTQRLGLFDSLLMQARFFVFGKTALMGTHYSMLSDMHVCNMSMIYIQIIYIAATSL